MKKRILIFNLIPLLLAYSTSVFSISSEDESEESSSQYGKYEKRKNKKKTTNGKRARHDSPPLTALPVPLPHDPASLTHSQTNTLFIPAAAQSLHTSQTSSQGQPLPEKPSGYQTEKDVSDHEMEVSLPAFPKLKLKKRTNTDSHGMFQENADKTSKLQNHFHQILNTNNDNTSEVTNGEESKKKQITNRSQNLNNLFVSLPFDIINMIFKNLSIFDQVALRGACKNFNESFKRVDEVDLNMIDLNSGIARIIAQRSSFLKKIVLKNMVKLEELSESQKEEISQYFNFSHITHFELNGRCFNFLLNSFLKWISEENGNHLENLFLETTDLTDEKENLIVTAIANRRLSNLMNLDLSNGIFTNEQKEEIYHAIKEGKLKKLKYLRAGNIIENHASQLKEAVGQGFLENLMSIDISGSLFPRFEILCDVMRPKYIKSLTHLYIKNIFDNGEKDCLEVLNESIQSGCFDNLELLDASGNSISTRGIEIFTKGIHDNHFNNLTHLLLSSCEFDMSKINQLANAFQTRKVRNLKHLDLSHNSLRGKSFELLLEAIKSGMMNIQYFNCRSTDLTERDMTRLSERMNSGDFNHLIDLDLTDNSFGDGGIIKLAIALQKNESINIKTLNFSRCGLTHIGIIILSETIKDGHLKSLTSLNLFGNKIGNEGIKLLSDGLKAGNLKDLSFLDLGRTAITENALQPLLEVAKLGCLEKLSTLHLKPNPDLNSNFFQQMIELIKSGQMSQLRFILIDPLKISKNNLLQIAEVVCLRGFKNLLIINIDYFDTRKEYSEDVIEIMDLLRIVDLKALAKIIKTNKSVKGEF